MSNVSGDGLLHKRPIQSSLLFALSLSLLTGCEQSYSFNVLTPAPLSTPQPVSSVEAPKNSADPGGPKGDPTPAITPSPLASPSPSLLPSPSPSPIPTVIPSPSPSPSPSPTPSPTPTITPSPSPSPTPTSNAAHEDFALSEATKRKVDFLFIVDNSGSMQNKQANLASGFATFAQSFFYNPNLDICTAIITSDRYLGRSSGTYSRERYVACTEPAGTENETSDQKKARLDAIVADFKTKVTVGTAGSSTELLGKSLTAFLFNLSTYSAPVDQSIPIGFFRSDAVANISFLTDEDNYYVDTNSTSENMTDLPAVQNTQIPLAGYGKDTRLGMKNYLDSYFMKLAGITDPAKLTYSVTAFLTTYPSTKNGDFGTATNIDALVTAVGRDSVKGDIEGSSSQFASLYSSIGNNILARLRSVSLAHAAIPGSVKVTLLHANGSMSVLAMGSDYTMPDARTVSLSDAIYNGIQSGDMLSVDYSY